jgi:methylglutamate dehydrogenase subunit D
VFVTDAFLIARSAFADLQASPAVGRAGLTISDRDGVGLATVLARKGRDSDLAAIVRDRFGLELPNAPRRVVGGGIAFAGIGPNSWLAVRERAEGHFSSALKEALGDLASVTDQSDGYALLRLGGPKVRETLAKLIAIDLHPNVFKPGCVARTNASHIGAILWRLENDVTGLPVFEVAVFRSLAKSFWHALSESGAEFGFVFSDRAIAP